MTKIQSKPRRQTWQSALRQALRQALRRAGVVCVVVAGLCSFVRAEPVVQHVPLDAGTDAMFTMTVPVDSWDGFGFLPVAVHVENKSSESHEWQVAFEQLAMSGAGREIVMRTGFTVTAPARTSRTTTLWLPGGRATLDDRLVFSLSMIVRGPGLPGGDWSSSVLRGWHGGSFYFAVSPALEAEYRARCEAMNKSYRTPRLSVMRPVEWPADWRTWSPFAFVVMNAGEFEALDVPRQAALRDWVALGGRLYLRQTNTRLPFPNVAARPVNHGMGVIAMSDVPAGLFAISKNEGEMTAELLGEIQDIRMSRLRPWQKMAKLFDAAEVEEFQLSQVTWWLILFLLAFGVLIGPVNLFLWAPAGKRHRLFFTVPVISLGASLALTCVIVFHDGFGGEGMRRCLVMLLPGENKAVVAQQQVSRTGMLLGKSFPIPDDVVLAKIAAGSDEDVPGKKTVRQAGAVSGDWFTSRAMESHLLMQIAPTRGRVEIIAGGGGDDAPPVVQSSMAGVLRDFVFLDAHGRTWTAGEVAPGRKVTLAHSGGKDGAMSVTGQAFMSREPSCFYAVMDATEIAPLATLGAIRWRNDRVLVTGRVEGGKAHE